MLVAIVKLAVEPGMRLGELLARDGSDIDVAKRTASLRETKNGESRVVPLSGSALGVLTGLPRHISNGKVFWVWSRRDSFNSAWRRAVARSGVTDLRFHDLRHKAVSRFFERGFNMMEVAAISGHKTLQMLKRYTHRKPRRWRSGWRRRREREGWGTPCGAWRIEARSRTMGTEHAIDTRTYAAERYVVEPTVREGNSRSRTT
jgi:integrase